MKCTFAGHSKLNGELSSQTLLSALEVLIQSDCTFIFYTGGMGDFDRMSAAAVRQLKTAYPEKKIDLILVLPYRQNSFNITEIIYIHNMMILLFLLNCFAFIPKPQFSNETTG